MENRAVVSDGWASLAGGMYLADGNHNVVGSDQAELLVNATVRRGWAEPRPAFSMTSIIWIDKGAQSAFERGIIQGSAYYDSPEGARFVYIADGHILSFNPASREMRLISPGGVRPFHRQAPFAWLQQRGRWMVCQDGIGAPVILNGDNAEINEDPYNGVPTGMMMADGWHRLAVVDPSRTKIFLSDHEFDPVSEPLKFTNDATYFKNAKYFEIPRSLGLITGIAFAPSFNNQDDWGPLMVFCEHGTRMYRIQLPRDQWLNQDISATILPTIGACAHGAIVTRGNDVVFSDHTGRIQTFKAALARRDDVRTKVADEPVWRLYEKEHATRRRWRKSVKFDNRIITTVWPEAVNLGNGKVIVRHKGMVVMEEEHLSDRPFVWSGLWTGVCPVAIDTGGVKADKQGSQQERCFIVSHDPDNVNRIYEIGRDSGPDKMPSRKRTAMWVIPRWMNWEHIFERKRIRSISTQLSNVRGRVSIRGWWQTAGDLPRDWFQAEEAGADRLLFGQGEDGQGIISPAIKGRARMALGSPIADTEFYRARPWFRIEGDARIEETVFTALLTASELGNDVSCERKEFAVAEPDSEVPSFWEPHSRELPDAEPLGIQVCRPRELSPFCD